MDLRVAAYAVVERRGKILLTHWRRGHLHGWTLPGGGLDAGEDPRDAVVREVLEETGLEAKVGKLLGIDSRVMVREDVPEGVEPELHTIRIVYRATVKDGPLRNEIGGSSDEARWVPLREIKTLRTLSLVQTGLRMAGITLRKSPVKSSKAGQPKQGAKNPAKQPKQGQPRQNQPKQNQPKQGQPKQNQPKQGPAKQGQPKQEQKPAQRSGQRHGRARRRADNTGGAQNAAAQTSAHTPTAE
ncbi:ADP-ribose pyrophosphatase YjhB (NUDIX family) [Leucobacter exalbidus]|uniref:ADP-ribose pyrophosphatase YjhB (NUDIX family) n=1 Tax=Leucobacter exalbidus TaxID=662960 RepID=A0A940PUQ3_9MICO|nr:ADP-ribose pyrophosphatase YjhB (NUDIX family) [Leucobacter exalbidus]